MLVIDGVAFDVPVQKLSRKAEFLDKYAERLDDGDLERELIGVYFNYQLTLYNDGNLDEYERLWEKLTEPQEFHEVTVPLKRGTYTFKAYFSNVGDELLIQNNEDTYFTDLTVNFKAKSPARRPSGG